MEYVETSPRNDLVEALLTLSVVSVAIALADGDS